MQEFKDSRLKYIEMPEQFAGRANEISLTCKQHLRSCEALAKRLVQEKPKTAQEFEKIEYYKDFVFKSAQLNEQVLGILTYTHGLLSAIAADSMLLSDAEKKDTIRMQSETIEIVINQREQLVKDLYDLRRNQIAAK